ncbi:MAG: NAD(P)H-dependent glycerol-3-phosphate dehydrogenase [Proteobacteria bacterium]|nr:NAD(P)H-dependent glycerol-3-phosphate dehydrogenase [Pseudomonadota bacterium]NCA28880.1 NAD(P)H-dependent glycerol-3-phosphate dehydrogenase [Pseudomonadota bacterium]
MKNQYLARLLLLKKSYKFMNKTSLKKIMVIGSGAWGTALANHIAINNHSVFLNSIESDVIDEINNKNSNSKYLKNIKLHKNLSAGFEYISDADFVFLVVPSDVANTVFNKIAKTKFKKNCIFVICSKGFEHKSLELLSDSFEKIVNNKNYAVLSGPNFAVEVAHEVPTVTTIASKNKKIATQIIKILNNKNFQAQYSFDPRTAEICGIIKNILAIGCGIVDGLGLGVNTKSALIVKGVFEIQLLCKKIEASTDVAIPAGFGDIFLTCSSNKSRNNSLGNLIALGKKPSKSITYEGASSAKIIVKYAKKHKLKLVLCEEISKIIFGSFSQSEIKSRLIKAILS